MDIIYLTMLRYMDERIESWIVKYYNKDMIKEISLHNCIKAPDSQPDLDLEDPYLDLVLKKMFQIFVRTMEGKSTIIKI